MEVSYAMVVTIEHYAAVSQLAVSPKVFPASDTSHILTPSSMTHTFEKARTEHSREYELHLTTIILVTDCYSKLQKLKSWHFPISVSTDFFRDHEERQNI